MASKVTCSSCGWSWNKSDSSKKDMYICHNCGKNNAMKNGGWLDKFAEGGQMQEHQENYNDAQASVGPGFVGDGYDTTGRNYSPAWGGQFQMGGSVPGAVGFTYARTVGAAPSNGKHAKKTKASAQNGKEMQFYQNGLDWKPNNISKDGSVIKDDRGQWAHPGEITQINSNNITMQGVDYPVLGISDAGDTQLMQPGEDYKFKGKKVTEYPMAQDGWLSKYEQQPQTLSKSDIEKRLALEKDIKNQKANRAQSTISKYTPKAGDQERMNAARDAYRAEEAKPLNRAASSKYAANAMENIVEPMMDIEAGLGAGKLAKRAFNKIVDKQVLNTILRDNVYSKPEIISRGVENPTVIRMDDIGYQEPATGELAPYIGREERVLTPAEKVWESFFKDRSTAGPIPKTLGSSKQKSGGWLNKYK